MSRASVVLRAVMPCPVCNYHRPTVQFSTVTVLARGVRTDRGSLVVAGGSCPECRFPGGGAMESLPSRWRLDNADHAKVEQVRARRSRRKTAA